MKGIVTLLGAGPGDEELITVKGVRRLKQAEVLVYDRLVNPAFLNYVSATCETIDVGKKPGMPCIRQEEIEELLIKKAKEGKRVVRLKSGDPYVFGRGGEEGIALATEGIHFEVVPGITSAIAGPTYAGIPLTYRDIATSFHVFTGHLKDETEMLNWEAISQLKGTLVFLMGMKNLPTITSELLSRGYADHYPIAIVEWGTHPQQRSIEGTLSTIVSLAEKEHFKAPSIIVVGDVVAFREQLNIYEKKPLFRKKIVVQESPTGRLPGMLKDAGAELIFFPARTKVLIKELDLPNLEEVTGLVVADIQSWKLFITALRAKKVDIRQLGHLQLIAIGHHTAKELESAGFLLREMGTKITDPAIIDALKEGENWYCLASTHKKAECERVYQIPVIETHSLDFEKEVEKTSFEKVDAICLPNSVAAMNWVAFNEKLSQDLSQVPVIVMGENTKDVLTDKCVESIVTTDEATIASICDKCIEILS